MPALPLLLLPLWATVVGGAPSWALTLAQQIGDDGRWPVWEYGLAGFCLTAVGVFANRSINRERDQHDLLIASLRAEMASERERHEREAARVVAQRDAMIDDFTAKALPVLIRVTDVLEQRQVLDQQTLDVIRKANDLMRSLRRQLGGTP